MAVIALPIVVPIGVSVAELVMVSIMPALGPPGVRQVTSGMR